MGVYAGPKVSSDGLVLSLDAVNLKGYDKYENLFTYSIFEQGLFVRNNGTFTPNATIAPDGTNTASLVTPSTSSSAYPGWYPNATYTFPNGSARLSFYAKANGYNWVGVKSGLGGTWTYSGAGYNLSTGETFTYDTNTNGYQFISADNVGNGWYRIVIGIRATSVSGQYLIISTYSNMPTQHATNWAGNGVSGAYFWGAQLERGSVATDYYPTTGTAKNRETTWTDLSGRGNNGTLTNGPTYSSANGRSIVFDGVDDYVINSSTSGIPTGSSSRTIQFWVYPKADTNSFIQLGTGGGGNQVYIVNFYNLTGTIYLFTDGINVANNLTISGVQLPTLNTWNQITFGNSGQNWFYYVNAVSRASGTWSTTINTIGQKVIIGKRDDYLSTPGNVNGNIAQISIYNRALTAAEIQQNFNATKSRYGL